MAVTQIKRDEHIRLADGRSATLSAVQFSDGLYEVMLLRNDDEGEEITSCQCHDVEETLYAFDEIRARHHVPELTGKYKKLAEDLRNAFAYGMANRGTDDGGSSNFDAPTVSLPGWDKALVEAAAKTAGTMCFEWALGSSKSYLLSIPGVGQGYTRTKAAEAMCNYLKAQGYDAGMYYQMD